MQGASLDGVSPPTEPLLKRIASRAQPLLAFPIAAAAAVLPFLSTLHGYFLGDDFGLVQLFSAKPPLHVLTLFTHPWTETIYGLETDELRPLMALSYQMDSLWGAANPFGYHIDNVVLHVVNTLLVLLIARRLLGLAWVSATFGALLFALLPIQAEVVAWISGRADSLPAAFYLATLLAFGVWRRSSGRSAWVALAFSVVLFVGALYSKQSAITMLGTLLSYDVLLARRLPWSPRGTALAYLPFLALTIGYLAERRLLFGNTIREDQITIDSLSNFALYQTTYLQMLLTGKQELLDSGVWPVLGLALIGAGLLTCLLTLPWLLRRRLDQRIGALLCFGPLWWCLTVAPLAVTYVSSRHLYLAAAGFAVCLALLFDLLWSARVPAGALRPIAVLLGATLLTWYAPRLDAAIDSWNAAAARSEQMAHDVWGAAASLPPGGLMVLNAPSTNADDLLFEGSPGDVFLPGVRHPAAWAWSWSWSSPFVYQPPFAPPGLAQKVRFVEPPGMYCCLPEQWWLRTETTIATWHSRGGHPPVIALSWDGSGDPLLQSDSPTLEAAVAHILDADGPDAVLRIFQAVFLVNPED